MSRRALILSICVPFVAICPQMVHAQAQNITDEAAADLRADWMDPVLAPNLLGALKLEAGPRAAQNASLAFSRLTSGLPSRQVQVFTLVSNAPGFWEGVAKASDPQPQLVEGGPRLIGKHALFLAASQQIGTYYGNLIQLSITDNDYQAGSNLQALCDLMDLAGGDRYIMQLYRACYAISPHDLFELVHAYVSSAP
jgi:hypothetical protein